ncbi:MAG TPA: hypothetical protein VNH46_07500, partial [Gemmatimonadales bacterium]|nr:hypothetical protein [Gemmatimonadales bacterium]
GGGTTSCSNIQTFSIVPGYYPGSKTWGAVWMSVGVRPCDPAATLKAVVHATQISPMGPDTVYQTQGFPFQRDDAWSFDASGSGASYTIDFEPVELESEFQVELDVYDLAGTLVESRSTTVTTPAPKISTTAGLSSP